MSRESTPPQTPPSAAPGADPMARRRLFAAAGTAGALATAAVVLPLQPAATQADAATTEPGADSSKGYRLTAHVQRYYQTARV